MLRVRPTRFRVNPHRTQVRWSSVLARVNWPFVRGRWRGANFGYVAIAGTAFNTSGQQASKFGWFLKFRKGEIVADMGGRVMSLKSQIPGVGSRERSVHVDPAGVATVSHRTPGDHYTITGQALGWGVDENVNRAHAAVRDMVLEEGVNNILLHAWSRGNEALCKLADRIAKDVDLAGVELRVIGHDPVPGPGRFGEYPALPSIVKQAVYFLADDDAIPLGFEALLPDVSKVDEVLITTFPADHAGAVGIGASMTDSAIRLIMRDLAEKMVVAAGGDIAYPLNLSNGCILDLYATIAKNKLKLGASSTARRRITWYEGAEVKDTTVGGIRLLQLPDQSNAWVSCHHLLVFRALFPNIYRVFIEGASVQVGKALEDEVMLLCNSHPTTFQNLLPIIRSGHLL